MTKMLASVRDANEAEIALKGGADIIDLTGVKGGVTPGTVRSVVKLVAGARRVSAFCDDFALVQELAATGVDYIRIGFLHWARLFDSLEALHELAEKTKLIAVLYAGETYPEGLPLVFAAAGFHGIMLGVKEKSAGRLLDQVSLDRIGDFIRTAHDASLIAGVAGALEAPDIPRLLVFDPDFIGFEGFSSDAQAVSMIKKLIPEKQTHSAPPAEPGGAELGTDKIFVRDFVLPVHIGAYSFEHGKAQNVRFDVTADVLRVTRAPTEMRHVVSYDLIMDGIRGIVARGHVELSETLAEEIAALILAHPRVTRVVVRVEKLELGPGGVGVEIERGRRL